MDGYTEQIVGSKPNSSTYAKLIGAIIVAFAGVMLMGFYRFNIGVLVIAVGGFLIWLVRNQMKLEYEYEFTNGDCSIDKIYNKASRKPAYSFTEGEILKVIEYNNPKFQNDLEVKKNMNVKDFTSGNSENSEKWYAFVTNRNNETVAVILELNEKSEEYVKTFLKKKIEK